MRFPLMPRGPKTCRKNGRNMLRVPSFLEVFDPRTNGGTHGGGDVHPRPHIPCGIGPAQPAPGARATVSVSVSSGSSVGVVDRWPPALGSVVARRSSLVVGHVVDRIAGRWQVAGHRPPPLSVVRHRRLLSSVVGGRRLSSIVGRRSSGVGHRRRSLSVVVGRPSSSRGVAAPRALSGQPLGRPTWVRAVRVVEAGLAATSGVGGGPHSLRAAQASSRTPPWAACGWPSRRVRGQPPARRSGAKGAGRS